MTQSKNKRYWFSEELRPQAKCGCRDARHSTMREQSPARGDEEDIILMNPNKGYPDLQKNFSFFLSRHRCECFKSFCGETSFEGTFNMVLWKSKPKSKVKNSNWEGLSHPYFWRWCFISAGACVVFLKQLSTQFSWSINSTQWRKMKAEKCNRSSAEFLVEHALPGKLRWYVFYDSFFQDLETL